MGSVCCFDEIQVHGEIFKNLFCIQYLIYVPINMIRCKVWFRIIVRSRALERVSFRDRLLSVRGSDLGLVRFRE